MDENPNITPEILPQKAHVTRLRASGAFVLLPSGENAWLPGREMYPDFKPHEDFRERGKDLLGQDIDVVEFVDPIRSGQKLVSYTRATNDPWKSVSAWSDGEIRVMEVVAKTKIRVVGIVSPGVYAEVLLEPVRDALKSQYWQDFGTPLVGDEIAGFFRKDTVDEQKRIVGLDYAGFIKTKISTYELLRLYGQEITIGVLTAGNMDDVYHENQDQIKDVKALHGIDCILLVDNEKVLLNSLKVFLQERVHKVLACETYDEAIEEIEQYGEELDLAIIDIHLPRNKQPSTNSENREPKDHLGLDLARLLTTRYRGCSVVLVTGEDEDLENKKQKKSEDLFISGYFLKPFGQQDLYTALMAANNPARPLVEFLPKKECADDNQPLDTLFGGGDLSEALNALRTDIDAEGVVLFSVHPVTYAVNIEASSDPNGLYSAYKPKLDRSPVRDVAIDGEEIFSLDASSEREKPKHLWLWHAYQYRSCIGVNISPTRATPVGYALFAFHGQPGQFNRAAHLHRVRSAAREIKHILDLRSLSDELREMKPFEVMGKMYGSMAHEIVSLFSNEFLLDQLKSSITLGNRETSFGYIKELEDESVRASSILRNFRTMARGQQRDIVEDFYLEDLLPGIINRFSLAKVYFSKTITKPCKVRMKKIEIELILFNLLLNAGQQIERLRFLRDYKGEVLVELTDKTDETRTRWGIIKVHDNGPGIHKRDFKRVFDIHYTTKEYGCGMGLDISRNIARGVKKDGKTGEVLVSRSILLVGATFEVRLPLL